MMENPPPSDWIYSSRNEAKSGSDSATSVAGVSQIVVDKVNEIEESRKCWKFVKRLNTFTTSVIIEYNGPQ